MPRRTDISTVAALSALALLLVAPPVIADTVSFEIIPNAFLAMDMAPDGRYVVGQISTGGTYIYDTTTNTMTTLPPLGLTAAAVSDDGTVVLGDIPDPEGIGTNVAAIWTELTGWQSIGHLPHALGCPSRSDGYELSADGSVAVGLSWDGCNGRAFRWTMQTGMLELEVLANGGNRASAISADGSVIGGFAQGSGSRTPAIWNGSTMRGELLDPPNGDALGEIHGISDDGTILLGEWAGEGMPLSLAAKWTAGELGWDREIVGPGAILPGWSSNALDIADDGTIVGFDSLVGNRRAWIQPGGTGDLIEMVSYIEAHGGTVPTGEALHVCQAISTDGRIIAGHSWPMTGGWLVRISPDPEILGDMDCSGVVDLDDVGPFALALVDPAAYSDAYPACDISLADVNQDGSNNGLDIGDFVEALLAP